MSQLSTWYCNWKTVSSLLQSRWAVVFGCALPIESYITTAPASKSGSRWQQHFWIQTCQGSCQVWLLLPQTWCSLCDWLTCYISNCIYLYRAVKSNCFLLVYTTGKKKEKKKPLYCSSNIYDAFWTEIAFIITNQYGNINKNIVMIIGYNSNKLNKMMAVAALIYI